MFEFLAGFFVGRSTAQPGAPLTLRQLARQVIALLTLGCGLLIFTILAGLVLEDWSLPGRIAASAAVFTGNVLLGGLLLVLTD